LNFQFENLGTVCNLRPQKADQEIRSRSAW